MKAIATRRPFLRTFGFACTLSVPTFGTVESHAAVGVSIAMVSKGSSLALPLYIADGKGFLAAHGKLADTVSASSRSGHCLLMPVRINPVTRRMLRRRSIYYGDMVANRLRRLIHM
jgi:hypothetical protein